MSVSEASFSSTGFTSVCRALWDKVRGWALLNKLPVSILDFSNGTLLSLWKENIWCWNYKTTYLLSRTGPIFWRDLATLKRTLATWSLDILRTTGSICLVVISWPHASDKAWDTMQMNNIDIKKICSEGTSIVTDSSYVLQDASHLWDVKPFSVILQK